MSGVFYHIATHGLGLFICFIMNEKKNKKRFFYVLYSDKTWVFDQSERAQGAIYIINWDTVKTHLYKAVFTWMSQNQNQRNRPG